MADFSEYRAVLAKIDAKFAEIAARHPTQMQCRAGCHACCLPGLSVSRVEAEHIAQWLADHPQQAAEMAANIAADPHRGTRCALLDAHGACTIYPVRPALCRAHGAPTRLTEAGATRLDVCPLNFADGGLATLDAADCIDQGLVATLLFVVGQRYAPGSDASRTPLRDLVNP